MKNKQQIINTCKICGKQIEKNRKYCSRECLYISLKSVKIKNICKFCNKEFYAYNHWDSFFCSKKCYFDNKHKQKVERFKLGVGSLQLPDFIRLPIIKRDNYKCFICGKFGNCVHHIDYNNKNHDKDNLVTLCISCHAAVTMGDKILWQSYFFNRLNKNKNQQIIIIEGTDKSGKSSIANILHKKMNIPCFKNLNEKEMIIENDFDIEFKYVPEFLINILTQTGLSIILDRSYPSQYVYSLYYNRRFNSKKLWRIDKLFSYLNAKIIICIKNNNLEKDEFIKIKDRNNLNKLFKRFYKKTKCNCLILNTTNENIEQQMKKIENFIRNNK